MTTSRVIATRLSPLLLSLILLVGCEDLQLPMDPPPVDEEPPVVLAPGLYPALMVVEQGADTARLELRLHRVEVSDSVSSFQGELRYDTAQVRLIGATLPAQVVGAWHEVEPGRVRFAGATLSGLSDGALLELQVVVRGTMAEAFTVSFEELTASGTYADLLPRVAASKQPLFFQTSSGS